MDEQASLGYINISIECFCETCERPGGWIAVFFCRGALASGPLPE